MEANETNPYKAPEGDLAVEEEGYGEIRFFSPGIRIGRMRYLSHCFLFGLAFYALFIPSYILIASGQNVLGVAIAGIAYVAILVVTIIAGVQRLHDLDKSGWLTLVYLVPLLNVILILYVLCAKGTEGNNRFGKQPPPNKTWNMILGWFGILMPLVGMLAAILLPAYQEYVTRASGL